MPIFKASDKLILFIHIPKAGGTSVRNWLSSEMTESLYMKHRSEMLPLVPQHFHRELLDDLFAPGFFDYSFTVVRNPFTRTLSEYNYRITRPGLKRSLMPKPSFDSWLNKTISKYKDDAYLFSNHVRPQHEFLIKGTEFFRLEDGLDALRRQLSALTGIEIAAELPHQNQSKKRTNALTEASAKKILEFYSRDFEHFGYDPGSWRDL